MIVNNSSNTFRCSQVNSQHVVMAWSAVATETSPLPSERPSKMSEIALSDCETTERKTTANTLCMRHMNLTPENTSLF